MIKNWRREMKLGGAAFRRTGLSFARDVTCRPPAEPPRRSVQREMLAEGVSAEAGHFALDHLTGPVIESHRSASNQAVAEVWIVDSLPGVG